MRLNLNGRKLEYYSPKDVSRSSEYQEHLEEILIDAILEIRNRTRSTRAIACKVACENCECCENWRCTATICHFPLSPVSDEVF
jgi:hypothetical protein